MKRFACLVIALAGMGLAANDAHAHGGHSYGGYQPWWNIFAKRCHLSAEEERLQRFWHDYYDALRRYYGMLDAIDWVAYYKNHGYQINAGCGQVGPCGRINYAPVFVSPNMQWAVPSQCAGGPPVGPGCGPMPGPMPGPFGGPMPGPMH